ncbi:serine/threonine protein phosphatase [Paramagnetospirillum kuznetsovii]|uniref:Serine/threonine protein phosphatase n=1 Tax=Paramagnetospirillum kuznetsovii TaxID=2053833 RepID=A0A364P2P0_9PROT|nr:metallophosphoesterase family protein [Paramagnetospirillum kuznetsovii]RAU23355.1 serine/threonine protein phosphatase [Paramagnetospirillum kuznetsovii]
MSDQAFKTSDTSRMKAPDGTRVYAIGDIHGRMDLFERLLAAISTDVSYDPYEIGRPDRVVVICMGDLIDRGPDSRGVIERLLSGAPATGPLAGAQFIALRGNHEDYMTQFLADFSVAPGWLRNGGLEAIRSYVGHLPDGFVADYPALQRLLYRAMPPSHLRFLSRMPAKHVEGDYLFVHAGIRPEVPLERQDAYDMMWIREPFLSHTGPYPKMVVHGHTQVSEPEIHPNRIAIDTGAYRSGRLTCLVLEGAGRRFLST